MSKLDALSPILTPRHLHAVSKLWHTLLAHLAVGRHFWCSCHGSLHGHGLGGGTHIWTGVRVWFMVSLGFIISEGSGVMGIDNQQTMVVMKREG